MLTVRVKLSDARKFVRVHRKGLQRNAGMAAIALARAGAVLARITVVWHAGFSSHGNSHEMGCRYLVRKESLDLKATLSRYLSRGRPSAGRGHSWRIRFLRIGPDPRHMRLTDSESA